ncbi:hypothetical protein SAMN05192559_11059 [Halobacillus karajensis]|uniref:Uncharacterized protein n=1 Tax=Halobacillus karajensis TaxID=195088 RepID=A0A024P8W2_9BACI|nr:hypothetical protein BN982_03826 [Halobacillus karajensis]CDQ25375.1 hypothetical protein BN983_03706 [Halobacillus karajensis]CDQ29699.1 hypothetical protein BN981_04120 [Halobacillus karajensis]SEI07640.1 hypothetical protein SAMN05192559_11059 [Halobacillus karajensis]
MISYRMVGEFQRTSPEKIATSQRKASDFLFTISSYQLIVLNKSLYKNEGDGYKFSQKKTASSGSLFVC